MYQLLGLEEEEATDYETEADWIVKKTAFGVRNYGNSCLYIRRVFKFVKAENNCGFKRGKIVDIVCKAIDKEVLYFKFFDADNHRKPPANEKHYCYIPCRDLMTTDAKKALVEWEGPKNFIGNALIGRRVCDLFDDGMFYKGKVVGYKGGRYRVVFDDGDELEIKEKRLMEILRPG